MYLAKGILSWPFASLAKSALVPAKLVNVAQSRSPTKMHSFLKAGSVVSLLALASFYMPPCSWSGQPSPASCDLCLYGPDNIVFGKHGEVYLVDTDHASKSRLLELSAEGKKLSDWRIFAVAPHSRSGPEGIALDQDGDILVTDAGTEQILRLSPGGRLLLRIGLEPGTFKDLGHVAVLPDGLICVSEGDSNAIQVFSPRGRRVARWIRNGGGQDGWNRPESIASLGDGTLVVEDWANHRVDIVSPGGKVVHSFGGFGKGPGKFVNTAGIAVDRNHNIYVADYYLRRVQEFDRTGKLLRLVQNSAGETIFNHRPGGIAVDSPGNLYSPDGLSVVKYSPAGKVLHRWQ